MTRSVESLRVSVVICAYTEQRWNDLVRAVASVRAQNRLPAERILVIDHATQLAKRARADVAFDGVTVVENHCARGLSGARNTGLEYAEGDIVAFLDDDAWARPGWLSMLVMPYARDEVVAVGGSAWPIWPHADTPATLPPELMWVAGCSFRGQYHGTGPVEVRNLMGCNMSFRRSVFAVVGGFDEKMGRLGRAPSGCEETELCIRLRQRLPGSRIVLEPAAAVDHQVTADREKLSYVWRRSWAEGRSKALVSHSVGAAEGLSAERHYIRRVIPTAVRRELAAAVRGLASMDVVELRRGSVGTLSLGLALGAAGLGYLSSPMEHSLLRRATRRSKATSANQSCPSPYSVGRQEVGEPD